MPETTTNYLAQLYTDSSRHVKVQQGQIYKGIVPNVTGMGLKDAVYILEHEGLQVQIQGRGRVQLQSLTPGTRIVKGQNIVLQLS